MNEDQLLRDLGRAARLERQEEARLDARWDALSAGTLPPDEEAALHALAAESDQSRDAWEAFRPLDKEFRTRVVKTLRAQTVKPPPAAKAAPRLTAWIRQAWTVPQLRWAAAAAAAVLVVFLWPGAEPAALPDYHLTLAGGVRELRSATAGQVDPAPSVFVPGNRLQLEMRPDVTVAGEVDVRLFRSRGEELTEWPEPVVMAAESGSFHVAGVLGREIHLEPGEWTVIVVVGRPGELPAAEELRGVLDTPGAPPPPDWLHRQVKLHVRAQP